MIVRYKDQYNTDKKSAQILNTAIFCAIAQIPCESKMKCAKLVLVLATKEKFSTDFDL